jgi:AraC-like DNA-binding protein
MNSQTNPLFLLYGIVVFQLLLLLFTLIRSKDADRLKRWLLAGLVVVLTWMTLEFALTWSGYLREVPFLMGVASFLPLLIGPTIWAYLRIEQTKDFRYWHLLHLLPFFGLLLWDADWLLMPATVKLEQYDQSVATESYFFTRAYLLRTAGKALHLLAYVLLGWSWWKTAKAVRRGPVSRAILFSGSSFAGLLLLHTTLLTFRLPFYALTYCILIVLMGILALWLQWRIIKDGLERKAEVETLPERLPVVATSRYEKSGLDQQSRRKFAEDLSSLMEEQRPFLRADLRLNDLAELVGLPPHQLSQVLNQELGQKFTHYVNGFRVEEAKKMLVARREEETILQIAFASGFNSKNSFNRAFKNITGVSPTAYLSQVSSDGLGR